jgi:hypothetical protein
MLSKQINLSWDIIQLRNDGYEVEIKDNHLVINNIPYFNKSKKILKGSLISILSIQRNNVVHSNDHRVFFIGESPCDSAGNILSSIINNSNTRRLTNNITIGHMFSSKPPGGYKNYHHKMESYINMIASHVESVSPEYTAKTFRVLKDGVTKSPFVYTDTNSLRSEIQSVNNKVSDLKIGIIGLGGTGSYILDLVSKTSISEIHLFDGDEFCQHNAFRSPGAASLEILDKNLKKNKYYKSIYSNIHQGIVNHNEYLNETNLNSLNFLDFVFIAIDKGSIKKLIFKHLEREKINFIDTGIGVINKEESLLASIRTTCSVEEARSHVYNGKVSFVDEDDDQNVYSSNIQMSELNALNACISVIKWKQLYGIYHDVSETLNSTYNTSVNQIIAEDVRA